MFKKKKSCGEVGSPLKNRLIYSYCFEFFVLKHKIIHANGGLYLNFKTETATTKHGLSAVLNRGVKTSQGKFFDLLRIQFHTNINFVSLQAWLTRLTPLFQGVRVGAYLPGQERKWLQFNIVFFWRNSEIFML